MQARDFVHWLQGYLELDAAGNDGRVRTLRETQVECIQKHLALVFTHEIDPSMGDGPHQAKLDGIHGAGGADGSMKYRC